MALGILTLIPLLLAISWPLLRLVELRMPAVRRRWQWGWRQITLPLAGLTLLGLISIGWSWLAAGTRLPPLGISDTAFQLLSLALVWATYLFLVNEQPSLTWPLAAVVAIQSLVGIAQFVRQTDLGLTMLGELDLDPAVSGVSVLMTDGAALAARLRSDRSPQPAGSPAGAVDAVPDEPDATVGELATLDAAGGGRIGRSGAGRDGIARWPGWPSGWDWPSGWRPGGRNASRRAVAHDTPETAAPRTSRRSAIAAIAVVGGLALLFLAVYGPLLLTRFFNLDTQHRGALAVRAGARLGHCRAAHPPAPGWPASAWEVICWRRAPSTRPPGWYTTSRCW